MGSILMHKQLPRCSPPSPIVPFSKLLMCSVYPHLSSFALFKSSLSSLLASPYFFKKSCGISTLPFPKEHKIMSLLRDDFADTMKISTNHRPYFFVHESKCRSKKKSSLFFLIYCWVSYFWSVSLFFGGPLPLFASAEVTALNGAQTQQHELLRRQSYTISKAKSGSNPNASLAGSHKEKVLSAANFFPAVLGAMSREFLSRNVRKKSIKPHSRWTQKQQNDNQLRKSTLFDVSNLGKSQMEKNATLNISYERNHPHFRRRTMMLPPAPVTPFRGGLKTVKNEQSSTESSEPDSLEASSSDHGFKNEQIPSIPADIAATSSSSQTTSSWTPDEYPNPFTDSVCLGALNDDGIVREYQRNSGSDEEIYEESRHWFVPATLGNDGLTSEQTEKEKQQQQSQQTLREKRLLFCDPDRVLDKDTLKNIFSKLEDFSKTFSSNNNSGTQTLNGDDSSLVSWEFDSNYRHADKQPSNSSQQNDGPAVQQTESRDADVASFLSDDDVTTNSTGDTDLQSTDMTKSNQNNRLLANADRTNSKEVKYREIKDNYSLPEVDSNFTQHSNNPRLKATNQWYADSVGGVFSALPRDAGIRKEGAPVEQIEVAIALVKKINLPAILRADSYFFYSDQDDMVNDAAQYFARYIHDTWSKILAQEQLSSSASSGDSNNALPTNIVLIFISTQDRICYISSGTRIATVLPWWRLEHVVQDMKPDLRKGNTGEALRIAIDDLSSLLLEGPPTLLDRVNDFFQRFGIVMAFTVFTFLFATWGECRDRRKRIFFAERRSRMTTVEKEKALALQKEFKTKVCPICLEPFGLDHDNEPDADAKPCSPNKDEKGQKRKRKLKRVDSNGIPLIGTDDLPIKLLRCGHVFDESCWKAWVDSGHGNPWICPVCRQDVGGGKKRFNPRLRREDDERARARVEVIHGGVGNNGEAPQRREHIAVNTQSAVPSMLLRPVRHSHPNYNSMQSWTNDSEIRFSEQVNASSVIAMMSGNGPFAPLVHPTFQRLHPIFSTSTSHGTVGEESPLNGRIFASSDNEDDY